MSLNGNATAEHILKGKIHASPVVDKTLTIDGACADAKVTGEKIGKVDSAVGELASRVGGLSSTVEGVSRNVASLSSDLAVERERINNLSRLGEGSTTGDAELADVRVGRFGETYANAGEAVRGQFGSAVAESASLAEDAKKNAQLQRISNGHFFKIHTDTMHKVNIWKEGSEVVNGVSQAAIVVSGTEAGSDYIKCPKYVCVYFPDGSARCRLYFYKLEGGEYVPRWDIVQTTTTAGSKNYLNTLNSGTFLFEMPDDNTYLTFGTTTGCELYGWDGEMFGMPMSADCEIPTTTLESKEMPSGGGYGVTIPGSARFIVSKTKIAVVNAFREDEAVSLSDINRQFIKLPEGYDFFRVRVLEGKITRSGDVSDKLSVVVDAESEKASCSAEKIIANCKKVGSLQWTPVKDLDVSTEKEGCTYKAGVTYNGLPYCSNWKIPHYVGWHVSLHTFLNAVNDSESIFYKETVTSYDNAKAPYYGTVCSAYVTMCAGWPLPQTNKGMLYDPNVELSFCNNPPLGQVYTSLSHCLVPERIDHLSYGNAVSVYESVLPTSGRTTRINKVLSKHLGAFRLSAGISRYDDYGYMAHHIKAAKGDSLVNMSNVPFLGMTEKDLMIMGGDARPYKGDKCVYTSEEAVLINIKNPSATKLYIDKDGGETLSIGIGTASSDGVLSEYSIDIKEHLDGDGIYFVWTDTNERWESFEYKVVKPITWEIKNGVPVLYSKEFWYGMFGMKGDPRAGGDSCEVIQLPADDYSYLIKDGTTCSTVSAIFGKGKYGAYAIPHEKKA